MKFLYFLLASLSAISALPLLTDINLESSTLERRINGGTQPRPKPQPQPGGPTGPGRARIDPEELGDSKVDGNADIGSIIARSPINGGTQPRPKPQPQPGGPTGPGRARIDPEELGDSKVDGNADVGSIID